MDRDKFYTVSEAAKVLGRGERWVRQLASDGVIEGERTAEGWQLLRRSVHDFRDQNLSARVTAVAPVPPEAREALSKTLSENRQVEQYMGAG
jgi:excisionase family DNA binding protein